MPIQKRENKQPQKEAEGDSTKDPKNQYPFKRGEGHLGESREKSPRVNDELGKFSLTEKQARVLEFINTHIKELGFPPTVRELAAYFNVSGKAAHDHIKAIAKKGYLRLFSGSARGIEVIGEDTVEPKNSTISDMLQSIKLIPLVGSIAAGAPILAEENIETKLAFPKSFLPSTGEMFALRVKGDSMEEAGILEGDIAVLKKIHDVNSEVKNGDIVAALIDNEATLKTWHKSKNIIELRPENERYKPIPLSAKDNPSIVGKLVGVYRAYR